jgi:shikimate kinase
VIVLLGFMGAGKTTVGNLLAARLGLPFIDSDQVIEKRAGRPVRQIFAEDGEPAFRALEHQVIAELLDGPAVVLALGGGAAEHADTRDLLARGGRPPPNPPRSWGDPSPQTPLGRDPSPQTPLGRDPSPRTPLEVVYLQVGYAQALQRVGGDRGRPLLVRPDLAALYQRRLAGYADLATLTVPTDGRRPEAITEDILARLVTEPAARGPAPYRPLAP